MAPAAPDWGWRLPGIWWRRTAGASGRRANRGAAAPSILPCLSPARRLSSLSQRPAPRHRRRVMPNFSAAHQAGSRALISREISFELPRTDREALAALPWERSLEDWPSLGVQAVHARRGESRHIVLFVEADGR